jgi:hypothetical protein
MAKKEVTAKQLVDRLLDESEPETIRRFLELWRAANELDLDDFELLGDWFTAPIDNNELQEEITARIGKLQTVTDALQAKTSQT